MPLSFLEDLKMKLLFLGTTVDKPYASQLTRLFPKVQIEIAYPTALTTVGGIAARAARYDGVITSSPSIVSVLAGTQIKEFDTVVEEEFEYAVPEYEVYEEVRKSGASIEDYKGSFYTLPNKIPLVVIPPLKQLITVPYAKFITRRYVAKILHPEMWVETAKFNYTVPEVESEFAEALTYLMSCSFIAADIETKSYHNINMVGFCGAKVVDGKWELRSFPFELNNGAAYDFAKAVLESNIPKIFHNGIYDNTWLLHWNIASSHWFWDTLGLMHSLYCELPRSLAFTSGLFVREVVFWKDLAGSNELEYNALDVHNTMMAFLGIMNEIPDWAITNYKMTFPLVAPSMMCGIEGVAIDHDIKAQMVKEQTEKQETALAKLRVMTNCQDFNPSSPVHTKNLLAVLGYHPKKADKKEIKKIIAKDTFAAILLEPILEYREASKVLSSYLTATEWNGRYIYSLNPFGTESGRFSSSKSHWYSHNKGRSFFRYGQQIQNTPAYVKKMLVADDGWLLVEGDKKTSESFCTALISQDPTLWEVLHTAPDFHKHNAHLFFGVPISEVSKELRQLSKPVNHGANYNMQAGTLVETMTVANVLLARELCLKAWEGRADRKVLHAKLSLCKSPFQIAEFLLERFHATYKRLKAVWYPEIVREVMTTGKLVAPSGFTRMCFGDPSKNNSDLNAYIAHKPQHLSVALVNQSFRKIWDIHQGVNLRLKAQIHDSIFFQIREGHEYLIPEIDKLMVVPITYKGKTMSIPNDFSKPKRTWK